MYILILYSLSLQGFMTKEMFPQQLHACLQFVTTHCKVAHVSNIWDGPIFQILFTNPNESCNLSFPALISPG